MTKRNTLLPSKPKIFIMFVLIGKGFKSYNFGAQNGEEMCTSAKRIGDFVLETSAMAENKGKFLHDKYPTSVHAVKTHLRIHKLKSMMITM